MFYEPAKGDHGLPHDPLLAIVAPRPIGWISTLDAQGRGNLSPYSFFNLLSDRPPLVGFSSRGRKDALSSIEETGEFVCNLASHDLRLEVNASSAPLARGECEMEHCGLEAAPSRLVRPSRIAAAAAALECRHVSTTALDGLEGEPTGHHLVIGQVIGVYVADAFVVDGRVDTQAMRPIMRGGYRDYFTVEGGRFEMIRPLA